MGFPLEKYTTPFGTIKRPLLEETIELIRQDRERKPVFFFLPATYEDAMSPAMANIMSTLRDFQGSHDNCIDMIMLGLDGASPQQYREVMDAFSSIPNSHVLWNDAPKMKRFYGAIRRELRQRRKRRLKNDKSYDPLPSGKGRNLWTALGVRRVVSPNSYFVTHDCDIHPDRYGWEMPISLLAPVVNPHCSFRFHFSKAYYIRLEKAEDGRMTPKGRVSRLLVPALIDALKIQYKDQGEADEYLSFLQSFKYPLAGEFAMHPDLANELRIQPDWGLEVSMLGFLFAQHKRIAQVDLGIYDHKHQELHPEDAKQGLNRMAIEITKTILRRMHELKVKFDDFRFGLVLEDYERYALRRVNSYVAISRNEGWSYDEASERVNVATYKSGIRNAYDKYKEDPEALVPLPAWDERYVEERMRLCEIQGALNPAFLERI